MKIDNTKELVFFAKSGSHAYGLNTPESDLDYRGIFFGDLGNYFGGESVEQYEGMSKYTPEVLLSLGVEESEDTVVYELTKIMKLLRENNPNIIELLHVPEDCVVYKSPLIYPLFENKGLFLCTASKFRFAGYAFSQLKRLKSHREWVKNPPKKKPERSDYGLKEETNQAYLALQAEIRKVLQKASLDELDVPKEIQGDIRNKLEERLKFDIFSRKKEEELLSTGVLAAAGIPDEYITYYLNESKYKNALKRWNDYLSWKKTRNYKRAEMEKKCGYDSKHGMHLIRLMRMSVEILSGQGVIVRRPDREELLDIKYGKWAFEKLEEEYTKLEALAENLYKTTTLQKTPNYNKIKELTVSILDNYFRS